ncbi:cytochrome c3 family protein [Desulfurivibrio alkaliphilus]|uniref:Cytochrome C family protein n=1 Tax=Desulfurivibrio alkaliphilus (strain DSM 19089 / UNIQEM U267 / AHT2) TaxID=589865 RepID=D6Z1N3_DESAT|nr:cytochrome c3 family protein [Desulfurivibrio alkaliphilus]ADH85458.1 cytochrome C family protein [Desulfurivibrio alkaliphilus AHT 2]
MRYLLFFALIGLIAGGGSLAARAEYGVPAAEVGCFDCHQQVDFQGPVSHQPVARQECSACHNPHAARHRGLLMETGAKLCYQCHPPHPEEEIWGGTHQPVRTGDCLACHDPHRGEYPGLLSREPAATCRDCHPRAAERAVGHAPFSEGRCTACHQPHQAGHPGLLRQPADQLCLSCHQQAADAPGHQGFGGLLRECLSCHQPHESDRPGLLRDHLHPPFAAGDCASCHDRPAGEGSATCISCHREVMAEMRKPTNHLLAGSQNGCIQCHSPHAGNDDRLLRMAGDRVCQQCHQATFQRQATSRHHHPPLPACTECHQSHGSDQVAMLRAADSTLCTRCHERQGTLSHPVGEEVIDHRTNRPMTCTTCHDPHGTPFQFHLVQSHHRDLCVQCHRAY